MIRDSFLNGRITKNLKKTRYPLAQVLLLFLALYIASLTLNRYIIFIINLIAIYIVVTVSLNLTNGYAGIFSLGHIGFFAIGAYVSSLFTFPASMRPLFGIPSLPPLLGGAEMAWPFFPAHLIGGISALAIAVPVGIIALRLRGHYFAVVTLGFMVIVETLTTNLTGITRGALGINGIPEYTDLWWSYGWVVISVYVVWRLVNSSYGRAMMAIREDEIAAQSMGLNVKMYRLLSFVIGAFFMGIAGSLYAHLTTAITPYDFSFTLTFTTLIMVIIGGLGSITGSVAGAVLLTSVGFALKPLEEGTGLYGLTELIYAALLIIIMLKRPLGIAGEKEISLKIALTKLGHLLKKDRQRPAR